MTLGVPAILRVMARETHGLQVSLRLRLRGIPIRWTGRISAWEPPHRFLVAPDLRRVFEYRCARLRELFDTPADARDFVRVE